MVRCTSYSGQRSQIQKSCEESREEGKPSFRKKTKELQNRQQYSTQTKSHQIRQMAKVHHLPTTKENPLLQNKSSSNHCSILTHFRSQPNPSAFQTPEEVQTRR